MKKVLIVLLALIIDASCKKSDVPPKNEEVLAPIEKVNLIVPENLKDPVKQQGDPLYNVIGYGYDVTGKFNDASSIRGNVIDIAAYVKGEKPNNFVPWRGTAGWHDSYDAVNAEELASKLSAESEETKNKNLFGATMTEFFPQTTAFSEKYVYGYYSHYFQYRLFRFWIDEEIIAKFRKYLNPLFQSDVQNLSPEMIVQKYGTQVLGNIKLGAKLDIVYQAEIGVNNRSDLQQNGYDAAIKRTFGLWTNRLNEIDSIKLRKIKSPALSFRVAGGDPSRLKIIKTPNGPWVDLNDWLNSIDTQNYAFIQADSTIPLFSFITDETKRSAVQAYIASYLESRKVKLTK
jgi:hypothetical protein